MNFIECFLVALRLGLTSFGGPVAHLGYFREAYVVKRGWVSEERFAELLAICQFMPGPASSQLGAAIGYERSGWLGGLAAWIGFTLPSAVLLTALAVGLGSIEGYVGSGWIHGLKVAAVAVVAVAIFGMKKKLCPTFPKLLVAVIALLLLVIAPWAWVQPFVILLGAIVGVVAFADYRESKVEDRKRGWPWASVLGLVVFVVGVAVLPLFTQGSEDARATGGIVKAGTLVFGGGHVVLPLLETEMVDTGFMERDDFLAGYGASQAVPGPMFTLGSYLGARLSLFGNPWLGGLVGTVAIFGPGLFLLAAGLPLWNRIKDAPRAKGAIAGANAAVVGLLTAALVGMIRGGVLVSVWDWVFAVIFFVVLGTRKLPVWVVVLFAAVVGGIVYR